MNEKLFSWSFKISMWKDKYAWKILGIVMGVSVGICALAILFAGGDIESIASSLGVVFITYFAVIFVFLLIMVLFYRGKTTYHYTAYENYLSAPGKNSNIYYDKVSKIELLPQENMIKLSGPLQRTGLYVGEDDFYKVSSWLCSHCGNAEIIEN
ncbi:MAG: hypothetical protein Q4C42_06490 [Clostridia bacterium]|nr:hypothetical protein [Clostridia bacterium]